MRFERSARLWHLALSAALLSTTAAGVAGAQTDTTTAAKSTDPRVGLAGGWLDAKSAALNLELVAHRDRPEGFVNKENMGDFAFVNADLAFKGNYVYQGGYHGFQIWDVSSPSNPTLRASLACPGGQGDVSVYKNLLFMSVEETRGRVDCGTQGVTETVSKDRFRGVRIFNITDITKPKQVAAIQSCRGSHTHTLVIDPNDKANIYVYGSGTGSVRSGDELEGCSNKGPEEDANTALFSIDVIKVPLASPEKAAIVSRPRIFADPKTGAIAGLWQGGGHGEGTQVSRITNQCHDITVFAEVGLAAGA